MHIAKTTTLIFEYGVPSLFLGYFCLDFNWENAFSYFSTICKLDKWMDEWLNEIMKEWTTEWIDEWMDEWMNSWMNEWMNEYIWLFNDTSWGYSFCNHKKSLSLKSLLFQSDLCDCKLENLNNYEDLSPNKKWAISQDHRDMAHSFATQNSV